MSLARTAGSPLPALAVRLGVIAAIFGLAVVQSVRGAGPYSDQQITALYALVLTGFLSALAMAALHVAGVQGRGSTLYEIAVDGVLISALVYCTGGASSIFAFLYNIWIVHSAVRFGSRGAFLACLASVASFAGLSWGPVLGWLEPFDPRFGVRFDEAVIGTGMHGAGFFVVTVLAHGLVRQVKRGREELRELGEIHRRIFENVSSGLLTVDRDGRITSFNREAERITGYATQEVLGQPLEWLFRDAAIEGRMSTTGVSGTTREQVRFHNRAGDELHLGFSSSVLRGEHGETDGAILIFQDLTRVVEMEAELRRSERLSAVGQLAAGLAHEIRNPLGALSGAIELLAADWSVSQPDGRLFRIVKRETERLNRLVSEFLSYARTGPGRQERVVFAALFDEMAKLWEGDARRSITLALDVPADLAVTADPDHLRQIFWNLWLNAAEAEPRDARIEVTARPCQDEGGDFVEVVVADRGMGIRAEELERIFEPFFTTKAKGTGLGLATVHRLVESAGGTISVRSEPAEGTRIRVLLPRAAA